MRARAQRTMHSANILGIYVCQRLLQKQAATCEQVHTVVEICILTLRRCLYQRLAVGFVIGIVIQKILELDTLA